MSEPKRACETCRWWEWDREVGPEESLVQLGYCRRFPPQATWHQDGSSTVPAVQTMDFTWCGEWKPKRAPNIDDTAASLAESTLLGDMTAARALADKVQELSQE